MLTTIFIIIAAICNAAMDRMEPWAFGGSIFSTWGDFWNRGGTTPRRTVFGWKFDGWHCAKSAMIVCFCASAVVYRPMFGPAVDLLIYGAVWNIVNPNFYGKVFYRNGKNSN
jgi:uncharacterized membrane protein YbaN (DUF454 family)